MLVDGWRHQNTERYVSRLCLGSQESRSASGLRPGSSLYLAKSFMRRTIINLVDPKSPSVPSGAEAHIFKGALSPRLKRQGKKPEKQIPGGLEPRSEIQSQTK